MIDLKALAVMGTDLAFDLCGQVTESLSYVQFDGTGYNPATGVLTPGTQSLPITAIVLKYKQDEIDGETIRLGDEKLLIKRAELATIAQLSVDDYLLNAATGVKRQVKHIDTDPTSTLVTVQTRKAAQ